MNILDENIPENQRHLLRKWRIRIRQIGVEIAHKGIKDENIPLFLLRLNTPTFFTRDLGFYHPRLCHNHYGLVCLDVGQYETASFIWRLLRHPSLNTQAKRMGKAVRVTHSGLHFWKVKTSIEEKLGWPL